MAHVGFTVLPCESRLEAGRQAGPQEMVTTQAIRARVLCLSTLASLASFLSVANSQQLAWPSEPSHPHDHKEEEGQGLRAHARRSLYLKELSTKSNQLPPLIFLWPLASIWQAGKMYYLAKHVMTPNTTQAHF